jgi:hypothetical protein
MAGSDDDGAARGTQAVAKAPLSVNIGPSTSIDLSWLPDHERRALMADYTKGVLDIAKKAQELHVEVGALQSTLGVLTATTREVASSGAAVTVTHTQTTATGRTEIIMGNTETAQRGKLTKSQTGEIDRTWMYVAGGLLTLVVIVALIFGHR